MHVFRDRGDTPEQKRVVAVMFVLDDQRFIAINRDSKDRVANSGAFTLVCRSPGETDYFENKLSAGGQKSANGWVKDKFGVSWNFGPNGIDEKLAATEEAEQSVR